MRASILICTHNRARCLEATLGSLVDELSRSHDTDVVVIDNGSSDSTREVVHRFKETHPTLELRYVLEPVTGLSEARNRGIIESRGDVVIFLDDDATVRPGWLEGMVSAFRETDARVVGGRVELSFEREPPRWLRTELKGALARVDLGMERRPIVPGKEGIAGANIAFWRSSFDQLGLFSTRLGRKGSSLLSGEEMEMCDRVTRAGGSIWYTPAAVVDHYIGAERVTKPYFRRRFYQQGISEQKMWSLSGERGLVPGSLRRFIAAVARIVILFPIEASRFAQELEIVAMAGRIRELLRRRRTESA